MGRTISKSKINFFKKVITVNAFVIILYFFFHFLFLGIFSINVNNPTQGYDPVLFPNFYLFANAIASFVFIIPTSLLLMVIYIYFFSLNFEKKFNLKIKLLYFLSLFFFILHIIFDKYFFWFFD